MQNNIKNNENQSNITTNVIIDNNDILKSKIIFFINNIQDVEIKLVDVINYIENIPINNIIKEIIEHNILNITENGDIILRNHYESDFMKDIGGIISFNYILSAYAKKNILSIKFKKFIINMFNHCLGLIVVSLDNNINDEQRNKLLLYCIKLTKRIMEFANDEIIKTTTTCGQLEQNIAIIKNDQKLLLNEITKYATIVNIQNDEIRKVNEKIDSLNNDLIIESKKEFNVKNNSEHNENNKSEQQHNKISTEEDLSTEDEELTTEELSNEADEEQIIGASNAPKNVK